MTPDELRAKRESLGLNQTEIAERLGVPRNTWWRWESGQLAVEKPTILALALDHLAWLAALEPKRRGLPRKTG